MVHTYGTNMQQSVWQLFSLFLFFLNQITMETVQKGREWGGHGLSIER